jgi:hypothetical protein
MADASVQFISQDIDLTIYRLGNTGRRRAGQRVLRGFPDSVQGIRGMQARSGHHARVVGEESVSIRGKTPNPRLRVGLLLCDTVCR